MTDHNVNEDAVVTQINTTWQPLRQSFKASDVLDLSIAIQQIPAPTFEEAARAQFVENHFRQIGLQDVRQDKLFNVYGWLNPPTDKSQPVLLIGAHLDTVFSAETDLGIKKQKKRVYGPGLGDNSMGVAALASVAAVLQKNPAAVYSRPVCFVANTCEEGLGNLDGMRAVIEHFTPAHIGAAIIIEGMALGRIYHAGIAVRRLKIHCHTEGGHSWLHFGKPSAVHTLVQLASDIAQLKVPAQPRTTYNIGLIQGGHSVNSIATYAECYVDLRSTTRQGLEALHEKIEWLARHYQSDEVTVESEVVGDRPAGKLECDHLLVRLAEAVHITTGVTSVLETGSTDANIFLANRIPAVVVGVTQGGNAHRLDEFIETQFIGQGIWQLLLLIMATAQNLDTIKIGCFEEV